MSRKVIRLYTASLLLGFNPTNTKENHFYKKWDREIEIMKHRMSVNCIDWAKEYNRIIQDWRDKCFIFFF